MTDIAKAAQESSDLALWQAYCEKKMALEEAADEIERLRAECQRLAGEVSRAHKDALAWMERAAAARREGIEACLAEARAEMQGLTTEGEEDAVGNVIDRIRALLEDGR